MRPIQMVDLKAQYIKIKGEVDLAISDVLETTAFINGKQVADFSRNLSGYLGIDYVIPCANGTDALQIALMGLGLQPGDEVITPSFTFIATTEVVALLGLKPVFADVDAKSFCIDPVSIKKQITKKTRAVVPVHLYGQSAPMKEIMDIAETHGLTVVEDNAQAIGGDYTFPDGKTCKTGTIGMAGTTSFFPSKNLGAYGDGGALFTNDSALAEIFKMIANHGQKKRYYHELVGCNSRLDSIQAAILNVKLPLLDEYIDKRRAAADYYDSMFAGHPKIKTPYRTPYSKHVFHQYTLILEGADRNRLNEWLASKNIPSMIYYPIPAHRQNMFSSYQSKTQYLEVTDWLTDRVISLPMHTELDEEQLNFIGKS
ncbi:MAG: DegT/DnrJ/EryC1/StrS family aminotransferase, partial [Bacteroidota bacterium]|nr:DegT/DnrJ/EryC1/StrS family aminotransferase [Bacteroidota bacterium]